MLVFMLRKLDITESSLGRLIISWRWILQHEFSADVHQLLRDMTRNINSLSDGGQCQQVAHVFTKQISDRLQDWCVGSHLYGFENWCDDILWFLVSQFMPHGGNSLHWWSMPIHPQMYKIKYSLDMWLANQTAAKGVVTIVYQKLRSQNGRSHWRS